MNKLPEKILKVVQIERRILLEIESLFKKETRALVEFNRDMINWINKRKITLINREKKVAEIREDVFGSLSEELMGTRKEMRIDSILIFMRKNERWHNILDIIDDVEEISRRINSVAEKNQQLIRQALSTISGTFKSVKEGFSTKKGYGKNGVKTDSIETGSILAGSL